MKKGFTLIEILVTVAIIGILAAIAIPMYQNYIDRAKTQEVIDALLSAKTSMTRYRLDNNTYAVGTGTSDPFASTKLGKYGMSTNQYGKVTLNVTSSNATSFEITATITNPALSCKITESMDQPLKTDNTPCRP